MKKPEGYEEYLGEYGPQLYDSWCGEPVLWGFKIVAHLGEEKWKELGNHGKLECSYPNWYLVTKSLTREEALKKYGEITSEEFGPRGGWKSVTFGDKRFIMDELRPIK